MEKELRSVEALRKLPIGMENFVEIRRNNFYYVDKTRLIEQLVEKWSEVSLFTRPRRFGKTLNMDMIRVFFETSMVDTSKYFKDKKIWNCGEKYRSHQGKYPVIFLTFKDVKFDSWAATLDKIGSLLQIEFGRHMEILADDKLAEYEICKPARNGFKYSSSCG